MKVDHEKMRDEVLNDDGTEFMHHIIESGDSKDIAFWLRVIASPSRSDEWFAWYPVQAGALSTGHWMWLKKVYSNRCGGVTIYQEL